MNEVDHACLDTMVEEPVITYRYPSITINNKLQLLSQVRDPRVLRRWKPRVESRLYQRGFEEPGCSLLSHHRSTPRTGV